MEKKFKLLFTFGILVVLIFSLYAFSDWFSRVTGYIIGEDEATKLTQCLDEAGAELYVSEYCADCEKQISIFGMAKKKLTIIECGKRGEVCPNLKSTPAWNINKKIYYGFQELTELSNLSNCNVLNE